MSIVLVMISALGSARAVAAELGDYRWEHRVLLVFAPAANDARLVETLGRIEASRCDFVERDMVIGVVLAEGRSTLNGHMIDVDQSRRLAQRFTIGENAFSVLLIGKDGGEKLRVDDVPDLRAIYAVIDGMPMRSREMGSNSSQC